MGRFLHDNSAGGGGSMSAYKNPITGPFGSKLRFFYNNVNWIVPAGVSKVRVRLWGGGGNNNHVSNSELQVSGGGGFAIKECAVTPGQAINIIVAAAQSTSSFGNLLSATGGTINTTTDLAVQGHGIGGDFNSSGKDGNAGCLLDHAWRQYPARIDGYQVPITGLENNDSIDYIGMGSAGVHDYASGAYKTMVGVNGGAGSSLYTGTSGVGVVPINYGQGGLPGGGAGYYRNNSYALKQIGARGLVIIEY